MEQLNVNKKHSTNNETNNEVTNKVNENTYFKQLGLKREIING